VEKGDSLWSIARKNGVSITALLDINGLTRNSVLKPGQVLKIPAATMTPAVAGTAEMASDGATSSTTAHVGSYTVKAGDSLAKIAKANKVTVRALKKVNHLHSDTVRVGQVLKIPSGKHMKSEAAADAAAPATTSKETAAAAPSASSTDSTASAPGDAGSGTYAVQKGDTPATIAKKFGMKTSELISLNDISDPRKLKIGQELKVKAAPAATDASSPASTTAPAASDKKPMSVEALEAATATSNDSAVPVVDVKPAATLSK
jgi:LysM repeat protein